MSKRRKQAIIGPCSYCGEERELEPDHVVPQGLFVDVNQAKVIVPACRECNGEKGAGEGDLRDYMITSMRGRHHPVAQKLLPQYRKSNRKGQSRIGKRAETAPVVPRVTPEGIYLGYNMLGDFDHFPKMEQTLRFIVRGLHFHETGLSILPATTVAIKIFPYEAYPIVVRDFDQPFLPKRQVLGPDVFSWQPLGIGSSDGKTGWLLRFYDGVAVMGMTGGLLGFPKPVPRNPHFLLKKPKGKRQRILRDVVNLGLVSVPPEDYLTFLSEMEEDSRAH
jgi:hypothetical protein